MLRSPAPALVVATPVAVGDEVEAGTTVVVLESMKMETAIRAPFAARVKELSVITGSQVETGAALIKLEQVGEAVEEAVSTDDALDLPADDEFDDETRRARARAALSAVVLGYDVPPEDQDAALSEYLAVRSSDDADAEGVLADEVSLLEVFADLAELTRNRPVDEDRQSELRVHSSREHFHTYLQSLDADRGGLPEQFRERLGRVLRHYGVDSLDRTPELEAAVFRIFLAQQRTTPEVALVAALLGAWSRETPPVGELAGRVRAVLERVGRVPQSRYPASRRPGPQRPLPLVRPAGGRRGALGGPDGRARRDRGTRFVRRCPRPGTTHRGAGRDPRADGRLPVRAPRARRPGPGADAGGAGATSLPRVLPARRALARPRPRRSAPGRDGELLARRAADPAGLLDRHGGRARRGLRAGHLGGVVRRRRALRARTRWSTSTSPGPTPRRLRTR